MTDDHKDDQGFQRIIGRRKCRQVSPVPCPPDLKQEKLRNPVYTRVPKGVFRYNSHEEANRDWEKWMAETMAHRARQATGQTTDD